MRPRKLLRATAEAFAVIIVVIGGFVLWVVPYHYPRALGITAQLALSDAKIVLIGDSLTAIAAPQTLCGERTINAGIPNFTTEDYRSALALFAPLLGKRRVFVALGTNDTWPNAPSYARFRPAYAGLLHRLAGRVDAVMLVPPARYGGRYPDKVQREQINRIITELAGAARIPVVTVPAMSTIDGVHPDAQGTVQWQTALGSACPPSRRAL